MKQTFDYLENVAFAATVCDKEGIVLYQNAVARRRDGKVIGKNLYNCHSPNPTSTPISRYYLAYHAVTF